MKKFFAFLVFAFAMISTVANAQSFTNPEEAYQQCKMLVKQGNHDYKLGSFEDAQESYEQAIECNKSCPDKQYMSDKRIQKKIDDCIYAINHDGKTRQQANSESIGQVLGALVAVGAVATAVAATSSTTHVHHHVAPRPHYSTHHDFGPRPHHDYHFHFDR